jgi:hypothetical protein
MIEPADLPEPGFPISEQAIAERFKHRHGRDASAEEIGAIIIAMADRDTTPPVQAPPWSEVGWTAWLPEADPGQERKP